MSESWELVFKQTFNTFAPVIGMAVGVKNKNLQVGPAPASFLKSESGGKTLSLTGMHGNGLRLGVM